MAGSNGKSEVKGKKDEVKAKLASLRRVVRVIAVSVAHAAVLTANAEKGVEAWMDAGKGPGTRGVRADGRTFRKVRGEKAPWSGDCLKAVAPEYPAWERDAHHQGSGIFRLAIDLKTGFVTRVSIVKSTGIEFLDICAAKAFRQWRWKPGKWKEIDLRLFSWWLRSCRRFLRERLRSRFIKNGDLECR